MEKIANEKNLKKQYELKNVQEGLVTKQVLKEVSSVKVSFTKLVSIG